MIENLITLLEQFSFTCYTHCKHYVEHPCKECQYTQLANYLLENDVVPVVRCKDCKYYTTNCPDYGLDGFCIRSDVGNITCRLPDDYCSKGQRKTNEE